MSRVRNSRTYVHVPRKPFPPLKLRDRQFPLTEEQGVPDAVRVINYVGEYEEAQKTAVDVLPRLAGIEPSRVYFKYIFSSDNTEHQIPPRYWYYATYLLAPESYIEVYVHEVPAAAGTPPPPPDEGDHHHPDTAIVELAPQGDSPTTYVIDITIREEHPKNPE